MLNRIRQLTRAILRGRRCPEVYTGGRRVRQFDARQSGWFLKEKGQLCNGFQIGAEDTLIDVGCGGGGASDFAAACGAEVITYTVSEYGHESSSAS